MYLKTSSQYCKHNTCKPLFDFGGALALSYMKTYNTVLSNIMHIISC